MECKKYKIEATGKIEAGPCVVEAPSPGSAIEYFLATHGMLSYDVITWEETDEPADESYEDFLEIMTIKSKPITAKEIEGLDAYHLPRVRERVTLETIWPRKMAKGERRIILCYRMIA